MGKTKVDFRDAEKKIVKFKKQARKKLAKSAKKEVLASIARGVSPVAGKGRFKKYSDSYKEAIKAGKYRNKKVSPVNLKLTGKMLKSIFVKITTKGVNVGFDSELAEIHNNKGAGKSKVIRRMIPDGENDKFSRSIMAKFKEIMNDVARKIFKR